MSCDTLYLVTVNPENIIGKGRNKSISICEYNNQLVIVWILFVCISDIPACVTPSMVTSTITGTVTSLSDAAYTTNNDVFTTASAVSGCH